MDFSSKQSLGVAVVVAIAAICIVTGMLIAKTNNDKSTSATGKMWEAAEKQVTEASNVQPGGSGGTGGGGH